MQSSVVLLLLSLLALFAGSLASPAVGPSALAVFSVFLPSVFAPSVLAIPVFKPGSVFFSVPEANASHIANFSRLASVSSVLPTVLSTRTASPAPRPAYAHGWCGIHLRQTFGRPKGLTVSIGSHPNGTTSGNITGYILDARRQPIGNLSPTHFRYDRDDRTVDFYSQLPDVMVLKMQGLGRINIDDGKHLKVRFSLGGDHWDSTDKTRCKVGKVDTIKVFSWHILVTGAQPIAWTRDMDCGFAC